MKASPLNKGLRETVENGRGSCVSSDTQLALFSPLVDCVAY
jgi:hypothetical protein